MNKRETRLSADERMASTFHFASSCGDDRHPVRIQSRATGRPMFCLAKRGAGANLRSQAIEVDDESAALAMVQSGAYLIRTLRHGEKGPRLVGLGGRWANRAVLRARLQPKQNPSPERPE